MYVVCVYDVYMCVVQHVYVGMCNVLGMQSMWYDNGISMKGCVHVCVAFRVLTGMYWQVYGVVSIACLLVYV